MTNLSVCIPTYFRAKQLQLCLDSLIPQLSPNDEVVIGVSEQDNESLELVRKYADEHQCLIREIIVNGTSVIRKLNRMAVESKSDWIVTLDDDAVPFQNWIALLKKEICMPSTGALGGRDVQTGSIRQVKKIGIVSYLGQTIGNHEKQSNVRSEVHFLKGVNMAIKKEFFPISESMVGVGPEPHWEIYLCRKASKNRLKVIYDHNVRVFHYPGPRHNLARESNPELAYLYNRNLVLAFGLNKDFFKLFRILIFQMLLGRSPSYGLIKLLVGIFDFRYTYSIWISALTGMLDGLKLLTKRLS